MADFGYEIVAPTPVYHADRTLILRLTKELQDEREKNLELARDLAIEKHKTQQLECFFSSLTTFRESKSCKLGSSDKLKIPKNESSDTLASYSDLTELNNIEKQDFEVEKPQIGVYSTEIRKMKIRAYKEKIRKYRQKVHVSRNFQGRSIIAKIKPRINGKFVKSV